METKSSFATGIICYVVSAILTVYYLILEFSILDVTSPIDRIKIILVIIALMYFGSFFLRKSKLNENNKLPKINVWVWFILYVVMLLNLTLFDKYFGRGITLNVKDVTQIKDYFTYNFNIIPFATINNYLLAFKNNNLSDLNFIYNIFGNILAFMPMAFFLPRQLRFVDRWYKFLIITSIIIIIIECLQMLTMSGSFDVDDYILNIFGALMLYLILSIKGVKEIVKKFVYLEY